MEDRLVDLEAELKVSFKVPGLPMVPRDGGLVDPWIMTPDQWRGVRPGLISDLEYVAFPATS